MLAGALQKMAAPPGDPAYSPTPVGWTKVYETGYLQWKPIWTLPKSSSEWSAAVAVGTIANPGTLRLNLNDTSGAGPQAPASLQALDRKSTRLNSSHLVISYAVFCLKKKNNVAVTSV